MNAEMLYALRDVAGVPSHPVLFLILGVLTFALHILAVQVMLGASGLVIWGALSKAAYQRQLAQAMLGVAKIAVSVAVVLGVAPLLFVQVIYDPFWYTSNVLSAWWVIGFILILTVAHVLAAFLHDLKGKGAAISGMISGYRYFHVEKQDGVKAGNPVAAVGKASITHVSIASIQKPPKSPLP